MEKKSSESYRFKQGLPRLPSNDESSRKSEKIELKLFGPKNKQSERKRNKSFDLSKESQ